VKSAISEKMLQEFLPKWEKQTGITGDVLPGLGGFMGDTNPNYAYRPHNPEHISKALNGLGSLLRQDAMMGASSRPFEGSAPKGIVRVHIPKEMHPDKIHNLYRILHEQGLAEGHSTDLRNGTMDIMHDSHPAAIKAGIKIHSLLGGQHDVETFPTHISFPSHGVDYDTVPSGREPSEPSAQAPSNPLQAEAAERLQQHIDAAHAGGGAQVRPPEHSNRGGTTPEVQDAEEGEDHPAWIDQRIPSTKNRAKSDPDERRRVDVPALRQSPKLFEKNVNLFRNYVNTPKSIADKATTEELLEHSTNHMVQNLLALHDAVPEDVRNRSRLWYDGSNAIARRMAQDHDIPVHAAAGVLAALSPQKDWYQNVSLADRILKLHKGGENYYYGRTMTPEMERAFHSIGAFKKPIYQEMFRSLQGKSLGDLDKDKRLDPEERARMKALWTRIHDEAHGDKSYQVVSPEGEYIGAAKNANGEDKKAGWGSTTEMAKAIQVLENMHDPDKISGLMGEKHKVRNFYNNILSPNSRHGDVTIDTHAVAAALYRALSGKSEEVAHNFGGGIAGKPGSGGSAITGIHGTYPIFADAYRRAAEARGILPREMQSITWEAIRGLFPAKFKSQKKNVKAVDDVWRQHRNGSIPSNIARDKINELAGGINNPTWLGGDNQVDEEDEDPGHETEFSGSGVHGQPAQAHDAGTEGPAPAPVALGQALKSTPQYKSGGSINHALSIAKTSRYR